MHCESFLFCLDASIYIYTDTIIFVYLAVHYLVRINIGIYGHNCQLYTGYRGYLAICHPVRVETNTCKRGTKYT